MVYGTSDSENACNVTYLERGLLVKHPDMDAVTTLANELLRETEPIFAATSFAYEVPENMTGKLIFYTDLLRHEKPYPGEFQMQRPPPVVGVDRTVMGDEVYIGTPIKIDGTDAEPTTGSWSHTIPVVMTIETNPNIEVDTEGFIRVVHGFDYEQGTSISLVLLAKITIEDATGGENHTERVSTAYLDIVVTNTIDKHPELTIKTLEGPPFFSTDHGQVVGELSVVGTDYTQLEIVGKTFTLDGTTVRFTMDRRQPIRDGQALTIRSTLDNGASEDNTLMDTLDIVMAPETSLLEHTCLLNTDGYTLPAGYSVETGNLPVLTHSKLSTETPGRYTGTLSTSVEGRTFQRQMVLMVLSPLAPSVDHQITVMETPKTTTYTENWDVSSRSVTVRLPRPYPDDLRGLANGWSRDRSDPSRLLYTLDGSDHIDATWRKTTPMEYTVGTTTVQETVVISVDVQSESEAQVSVRVTVDTQSFPVPLERSCPEELDITMGDGWSRDVSNRSQLLYTTKDGFDYETLGASNTLTVDTELVYTVGTATITETISVDFTVVDVDDSRTTVVFDNESSRWTVSDDREATFLFTRLIAEGTDAQKKEVTATLDGDESDLVRVATDPDALQITATGVTLGVHQIVVSCDGIKYYRLLQVVHTNVDPPVVVTTELTFSDGMGEKQPIRYTDKSVDSTGQNDTVTFARVREDGVDYDGPEDGIRITDDGYVDVVDGALDFETMQPGITVYVTACDNGEPVRCSGVRPITLTIKNIYDRPTRVTDWVVHPSIRVLDGGQSLWLDKEWNVANCLVEFVVDKYDDYAYVVVATCDHGAFQVDSTVGTTATRTIYTLRVRAGGSLPDDGTQVAVSLSDGELLDCRYTFTIHTYPSCLGRPYLGELVPRSQWNRDWIQLTMLPDNVPSRTFWLSSTPLVTYRDWEPYTSGATSMIYNSRNYRSHEGMPLTIGVEFDYFLERFAWFSHFPGQLHTFGAWAGETHECTFDDSVNLQTCRVVLIGYTRIDDEGTVHHDDPVDTLVIRSATTCAVTFTQSGCYRFAIWSEDERDCCRLTFNCWPSFTEPLDATITVNSNSNINRDLRRQLRQRLVTVYHGVEGAFHAQSRVVSEDITDGNRWKLQLDEYIDGLREVEYAIGAQTVTNSVVAHTIVWVDETENIDEIIEYEDDVANQYPVELFVGGEWTMSSANPDQLQMAPYALDTVYSGGGVAFNPLGIGTLGATKRTTSNGRDVIQCRAFELTYGSGSIRFHPRMCGRYALILGSRRIEFRVFPVLENLNKLFGRPGMTTHWSLYPYALAKVLYPGEDTDRVKQTTVLSGDPTLGGFVKFTIFGKYSWDEKTITTEFSYGNGPNMSVRLRA